MRHRRSNLKYRKGNRWWQALPRQQTYNIWPYIW